MPISKVSVVIPTYNRAGLIGQAVDSVLSQTYRDLEIIVVDNGSTDGTPECLAERYGETIKVIRLHPNQGRSVPRNVGVRAAEGDYIAFLDSDDLWYPEKLECQVPLLEANPRAGLVHSFSEIVDQAGNLLRRETEARLALHRQAVRRGYTYAAMSLRCIMFTSTIVARRTVLESIGLYDTDMPILEDWDLYLRLSLVAEVATVEQILTKYRQHTTHTSSEEHVAGRINACRKHLRLLDDHPEWPFARISRRNFLLNLAAANYVGEDTAECGRWMRAAMRVDPRVLFWPQFIVPALIAIGLTPLVNFFRWSKHELIAMYLVSKTRRLAPPNGEQ